VSVVKLYAICAESTYLVHRSLYHVPGTAGYSLEPARAIRAPACRRHRAAVSRGGRGDSRRRGGLLSGSWRTMRCTALLHPRRQRLCWSGGRTSAPSSAPPRAAANGAAWVHRSATSA